MPDHTARDPAATDSYPSRESAPFPIVGVGASAGGLEAFTQLLRALPPDTGMAFVLVQHLSPTHESALAEILGRATRMPVMEVNDTPVVEPNHVYVIPPNRCMDIADGALQLAPREKAGNTRVIDHFFRALAEDRRHLAIGVVLSGTASDGTLGLEAIKAEGGITFAQNDSAQYEGMPHSAIASGCVDLVLPPGEIARELARIARHPYAVPDRGVTHEPDSEPKLARVLQLLRRATGVDFSQYKFNTVYRRVTRRMVLHKLEELNAYADFLQNNPDELQALYADILIGVTSFFRNPEAFDALKEKVFPRLLDNRGRHDAVRIWTLGCSTGQEAYSVAMAFTEFAESRAGQGNQVPLQIFATDLSEAGVDTARAGIYPKDIAQDVSPERLRRFFVEIDGHYRIAKSIRDVCVFSRHNMLADPPFSRLDLVTCRNLLIYLEPVLQQKIVPTLHYALKPSGYLWLGTSETIGGFRNLFEPLDAKQKIYTRKPGPHGAHFPLQHGAAPRAPFIPVPARASNQAPELHREADRLLLTRFAPPSVLVSPELDILQYRGDTGPYLAPTPGKASLSLPKMLREGLLIGVRAALQRAGKSGQPTREEGLRVSADGRWRELAVEVVPLKGGDGKDGAPKDGGFLVLFDEPGRPAAPVDHGAAGVDDGPAATARPPAETDRDNARLRRELAATREYLQSVIEQQEAANEELQSSNEEIQSANEELQSINEELETSKEEIQSSNEELATVNDELNNRNTELNRLNNDLVNVFASVQVPIVLVGPDLRVRRFTPAAEKQLHLLPGDIGRPLSHIKLGLADLPDLEPLLGEVLDTVSSREIEVRDASGHRHMLRLRPYRTLDNRIDGVVAMLVDVEALRRAHDYTESIVATVREPLLVLDDTMRVQTASRSYYRNFRARPDETEGRLVFELGNGQWDIPELRRLLEQVLPRDEQFNDFEVRHGFDHLGQRTMLLNARRLQQPGSGSPAILLAIEDVTGRRQAQAAQAQLAAIVASSMDAIISKDLDGVITSWNVGAERLFGYTADEAIGQPVTLLIPGDHLDEEPQILRRIRQGEVIEHYDTVRRRKDGSLIDISLTVSPMRDDSGRVVGASKVARDITERRRSEQAVRESDRHKDEFLAMLAHELRNPLAPIRNALQILRLTRADDEAARAATQVMERQVAQMVRLVDDLLDVSRISRGRIELRRAPVELAFVVQQAVDAVRPVYAAKGIELSVALPPQTIVLDADAVRLTQVVGNLLNNAGKFTPAGGRVDIATERDGDEAVIRVRDNGIGIAAEGLARIFDMFVQEDTSLERSGGGLGIGLTLVKNLAALHGGTVQVASDGVGRGSEFVVRLPIAADAVVPAAPAPPTPPASVVPRRVLVVDDNRDAAESLSVLLELSGHEARMAHDGLDAVAAAAVFQPDLVLLDIGLPRLNGYDAARRLRGQPGGQGMVLVALTGWGQQEDRQKSSDAGFDAHLVKPVDPQALVKLLAELPVSGVRERKG